MVNKPRRRVHPGRTKWYLASFFTSVLVVLLVVIYAHGIIYPPGQNFGYARIDTSLGSFEVELFKSSVPATVVNFENLATGGFYTNLTWHRIEKNFVIQTGDPNTKNGGGNRSKWGFGSNGSPIAFESSPDLHNYRGYLAMASTAPYVGGTSQFYINLSNNTSLDGKYAVFGKVLADGMKVVDQIGSVPTIYNSAAGIDEPVSPVLVYSVTIISRP